MFDIVIEKGLCYAGDGGEPFRADLGIKDGKIEEIGDLSAAGAARKIDASGLSVSPGFIDTHSHSDLVALAEPGITNKTAQGITTDIIGQDGMSLAPIKDEYISPWKKAMAGLEGSYEVDWTWRTSAEYLAALDKMHLGPNLAYLAPFGNLRMCAVGLDDRPASKDEISKICSLLEDAISAGAVGMSTGMIYPPCNFASGDEMVEVMKVLARHGLPFVIHQRSEADDILASMDEVFSLGRKSGCHIHFSHFKVAGLKNAHLFEQVMEKLDARSKEMPVSIDQYPYTAGSTTFSVILPPWAHSGGADRAMERLADPGARERMKRDIREGMPGWDNFVDFAGMENIYITFVRTEKNMDLVGKNMIEMGEIRGKDPLDASLDLLLEDEMAVGLVDFYGTEEHIGKIMAHPLQNPCTDGILGNHPHPRVYGAFPRILGRYVREKKLFSVAEAVRKMTSRPASLFKIKDRGLLKKGYWADITVFDEETVTDTATYEEPKQFPSGIPYVLVNGKAAIDAGKPVGGRSGSVVRFGPK